MNALLDKEADDAATQLDQLMKAKSFSIITSLREMFQSPHHLSKGTKLSNETYIDVEVAPDSDNNGQFVEMKSANAAVSRREKERNVIDDDVDSPLAHISE